LVLPVLANWIWSRQGPIFILIFRSTSCSPERIFMTYHLASLRTVPLLTLGFLCATPVYAGSSHQATVAALDSEHQEAVKRNDANVMARILADDFVLVSGIGQVFTRDQVLNEARSRSVSYEKQDEVPGTQTVRVWGDTAVVTALLWLKGVDGDKPFDRKVWFSDTYVLTGSAGWKYVFGQVGRVVERDGKPVLP
jgi:ketosteroid isomerase-like protein